MSKARYPFKPDYAVAPGETLREAMETLRISVADLASRTSVSPARIRGILRGTAPMTPYMAGKLSRTMGISARMWLRLEANYRRDLARAAERKT